MMWINFLCLNKMNVSKTFEKLCDPAKLYLLLSFSSVVIYLIHLVRQGVLPQVSELAVQVVVMFVWTYILNKVCTFKYGVKISWFLVALPILFMIAGVIILVFFIHKINLNKGELKDFIDQVKELKEQEEDDGLEGFQGCGNTN